MATQGQWGGLFDGEWFGATGEAPPGAMSGAATFAFSATGTLTAKVVQRTDGGPDELDRAGAAVDEDEDRVILVRSTDVHNLPRSAKPDLECLLHPVRRDDLADVGDDRAGRSIGIV